MIDTLLLLAFNLLVIIGINRITEYGHDVDGKPIDKEFAWFIRWYAKKWLGWWAKPVCTCIVCMSSLHSLYIFWAFHGFVWFNLYLYVVYMLALAGISAIYERLHSQ